MKSKVYVIQRPEVGFNQWRDYMGFPSAKACRKAMRLYRDSAGPQRMIRRTITEEVVK